ncbi:MAG: right-handed parallel beta-helix repeat-containing protein [Acidobacteriaceae bacterium]|nr:right-handed parallel beta-helix repeat-containing protein [Acidobacteriaceae bacterium]
MSVSVSPTSSTVQVGNTQQFTASVQNTSNTRVTWQVNGGAGSASVGTISASGLYTAPTAVPKPATVTITAVSQASPGQSASAQVTITATSSTPPPPTGAAFYVSPSGSDSNSGTISLPWKTIQHAANSVQPGDTVYVRAGVYNESVNIAVSGTAASPIAFQNYPGETAVVDGTGLTPTSSDVQGLFNIVDKSYVTIQGFEIRNFQTSSSSSTPAGIWVTGSGSHVQILNNVVHNIVTTSEANGNAFGIAVYGSEAPTSIDSITISGNQVYSLKTGNSETVNVDGNVTNFTISNNIIHDNDNIGIDAIGFEGVAPNAAYDYARNGEISGNTIYNISAINNPGEGNQNDADAIYVDGGSQIVIERNRVYGSDIGIEVASEHAGHVGSYVTVRDNLVYQNLTVGITIGGYSASVGGTDHCTIVNNTLFENDTQNTGSGELQIQYAATNNVFENNILYANAQNLFVNDYTTASASPAALDYNLYFSEAGESSGQWTWNGQSYTGLANFQKASGHDSHTKFADPQFVSLTTPDLHIDSSSPAVGAGTNLGASVVGTMDFAGNPRVQGTSIDVGAYE